MLATGHRSLKTPLVYMHLYAPMYVNPLIRAVSCRTLIGNLHAGAWVPPTVLCVHVLSFVCVYMRGTVAGVRPHLSFPLPCLSCVSTCVLEGERWMALVAILAFVSHLFVLLHKEKIKRQWYRTRETQCNYGDTRQRCQESTTHRALTVWKEESIWRNETDSLWRCRTLSGSPSSYTRLQPKERA